MTDRWLLLPVLLPMAAALLMILFPVRLRGQFALCLSVAALGWLFSVTWLLRPEPAVLVHRFGDWPLPFGIVFVGDPLASLMLFGTYSVGLSVVLFSSFGTDLRRTVFRYYPLVLLLLAGVSGAFLTGDLFNLFVWFEILLMASYGLVTLGGTKRQLQAGVRYLAINLLTSTFFLVAVAVLYGLTGTLNMADLARKLAEAPRPGLVSCVGVLFLFVFGLKAAIFPLYFWLPAAYPVCPPAMAALFAGLLTKVGVYSLIRVFSLFFGHDRWLSHDLMLVIAALTMLTGGYGAIVQNDFKRILSYHIINQVGYMIMGIGLQSAAGLAAAIYFTLHNMLVKTSLFLAGGTVEQIGRTSRIKELGGYLYSQPVLAAGFLASALSLSGLPPFSGFFGKFYLAKAGIAQQAYPIILLALLSGFFTLFSMVKIWSSVFWGTPKPAPSKMRGSVGPLVASVLFLSALSLWMGLGAEFFFHASLRAARFLDPAVYADAVLGGP